MEAVVEFHTIWIYQSGNSFRLLPCGHKLGKIVERYWLEVLSWFLDYMSYLSRLITLGITFVRAIRSQEQHLILKVPGWVVLTMGIYL